MPQHKDWEGKFFLNRQTKCQDRESLGAGLQGLGLCIGELKAASQQLLMRVVKENLPNLFLQIKGFLSKAEARAGSGLSIVGLILLWELSPGCCCSSHSPGSQSHGYGDTASTVLWKTSSKRTFFSGTDFPHRENKVCLFLQWFMICSDSLLSQWINPSSDAVAPTVTKQTVSSPRSDSWVQGQKAKNKR